MIRLKPRAINQEMLCDTQGRNSVNPSDGTQHRHSKTLEGIKAIAAHLIIRYLIGIEDKLTGGNTMNKVVRKRNKRNQEPKIVPGTYEAEIIAVNEPEGFRPGSTLDVIYAVKCGQNLIMHRERFSLTAHSDRLDDLNQVLDEIGSDVYEDLIGATVSLTFYYELKSGRKYCNITERKLVERGADDDIDCA